MPTITVEKNEHFHRGPACYRLNRNGSVTVMCPYGHVVDTVAPKCWAYSAWSTRASWREDTVTCHGTLRDDAKPYPFSDTFMGTSRP